ncbi:fructosamine-3-kinase [Allocatelliglobosispora scoriae]|uniref:Fructosamine-3-kinase n=1 Tax=Allocatelliglobosispora scoriae TaxID=643052 RepID=A0A841BVJ8_9ACTN|nr:fructosamine kinase family protein [Allocatelliglobosispora scoriae]MBB5870943.1 fructosamine-3-kinase [Allocatelliglobosispora scoriae]
MDMAYLREHPHLLPTFLKHQRIRETPVPGGSICVASRLTLDGGESIFTKSMRSTAPPGFFATEAAGLRWLAEPGTVAVAEVLLVTDELLALEWIEPGEPSAGAAEEFGRALAALHAAGAESFGAPWPGFIGVLPMSNVPEQGSWSAWFWLRRLLPYAVLSRENGALDEPDLQRIERVGEHLADLDPGEAPARIHGDLWPGNLLWGADGRCHLIDPAAHGGHRETDLANLGLFGGVPHLDRILAAYDEAAPLADGWRARIGLHQLFLLLVHTALFGRSYRGAVLSALSSIGH